MKALPVSRLYGLNRGVQGLGSWSDPYSWFDNTPSVGGVTYNRAAVLSRQESLRGQIAAFSLTVFGSMGLPAETEIAFRKECSALADKLRASGVLDAVWADNINYFANNGALMAPALDESLAGDTEASDAIKALRVKFGFADLKHRILKATSATLEAQSEDLAKSTAFWDTAYTSMRWISGVAAVDACNDYLNKIGASVNATRGVLSAAQGKIPTADYAKLLSLASPINGQLSRVSKMFSNSQTVTGGALGAATLAIVIVAGVALVILAGIYAAVEKGRIAVTAEANRMIANRAAELRASLEREKQDIMLDPMISDNDKAGAIADAERKFQGQILQLPPPLAAPASSLPALGSMTGILLIGVAAVGALYVLGKGK